MIRQFYIDNFKSQVNFALPANMRQFAWIVGLNGSGSSTLLTAFDFVGHLASGQVADLRSKVLGRDEQTTPGHLSLQTTLLQRLLVC